MFCFARYFLIIYSILFLSSPHSLSAKTLPPESSSDCLLNFIPEVAIRKAHCGISDGYVEIGVSGSCHLYTSPSPRDATLSRMPSSA